MGGLESPSPPIDWITGRIASFLSRSSGNSIGYGDKSARSSSRDKMRRDVEYMGIVQ